MFKSQFSLPILHSNCETAKIEIRYVEKRRKDASVIQLAMNLLHLCTRTLKLKLSESIIFCVILSFMKPMYLTVQGNHRLQLLNCSSYGKYIGVKLGGEMSKLCNKKYLDICGFVW
jgi:hypothetical protein